MNTGLFGLPSGPGDPVYEGSTKLIKTTDQTMTVGSTNTMVMDAVVWDDLGIWDPRTPDKVIIRQTGRYRVIGEVREGTNTQYRTLRWSEVNRSGVNGDVQGAITRQTQWINAENVAYLQCSGTDYLDAGDIITLAFVYGGSGGTTTNLFTGLPPTAFLIVELLGF